MRSITITNFDQPRRNIYDRAGNHYMVSLGNNTVHRFKTKAETFAFLAETSRMLTRHLHEVNMHLGELTAEYRRCWPYFEARNADNQSLAHIEHEIVFGLSECNRGIEFALNHAGEANYNSYAFEALNLCYSGLQSTAGGLVDFYIRRSQNAEANRYRIMSDLLSYSRLRLSEYGKGRANVHIQDRQPLADNDRFFDYQTHTKKQSPDFIAGAVAD